MIGEQVFVYPPINQGLRIDGYFRRGHRLRLARPWEDAGPRRHRGPGTDYGCGQLGAFGPKLMIAA